MEFQHRRNMILGMARRGAFYEDSTIVRNRNRIQFHSTWILLRSNTIQQIVDGTINQDDSSIINSVTLSNNIPRRSMEFVLNAPEQYQHPTITLDENDEYITEPYVDAATNNADSDSDDNDDYQNYDRYSDDSDDWDNYRTDI